MKKKEWLEQADVAMGKASNQIFNMHNWLNVLERLTERQEKEIVLIGREGREYRLETIVDTLQKSLSTLSVGYTSLAELAKGLINSVPDNTEIRSKMSLFE